MKTCLYRFLGKSPECKKCEKDYGDYHPNNHDCLKYYEINVHLFEVKENKLNEFSKTKNARI